MSLNNLPIPSIIESLEYEKIVERKVNRVKALMQAKGLEWDISPMDDLMTMIEADAYDELLLIAHQNEKIRQQLLAFATGGNLDHIAASRFGTERLDGSRPYATFRITRTNSTLPIILAKGLLLGDGAGAEARLLQDTSMSAGITEVEAVFELDVFTQSSSIRTEYLLTAIPHDVTFKQLGDFNDGADVEDDERFRIRTWESRERKSTAGSELKYIYYAKTADVRIDKVKVIRHEDDLQNVYVDVYVLGYDGTTDDLMISRVEELLNAYETRPLSDTVRVYPVEVVPTPIEATITLYTLSDKSAVDAEIKKNFDASTMLLGKSLTLPKIYDLLGGDKVYDVALAQPTSSVLLTASQVIKPELTLTYEVLS